MFAVPGWSVSADSLKTEKESKKKQERPEEAPGAQSKKRKRDNKNKQKKDENVTSSNVANLWERVIEGKTATHEAKNRKDEAKGPKAKGKEDGSGKQNQREKQKQKQKQEKPSPLSQDGTQPSPKQTKTQMEEPAGSGSAKDLEGSFDGFSDADADADADANGNGHQADEAEPPAKKSKKDKADKKAKGKQGGHAQPKDEADTIAAATPAASATVPPPAPPAPAKLTPLQASMRAKLVSARFRHLNETLYTNPSAEALRLFTESPDMFSEYHEGFRRQVGVWPENPVDGYIRDIQSRAKVRPPRGDFKGRGQQGGNEQPKGGLVPLPRTDGTAIIADLGCGDARLAETLQPQARKLKLKLSSFDLHSPNPRVTRADMANLPLQDDSVDVAIFCLALMGTNWVDFVEEAYRILHWKGELWVAEIKSRFGSATSQRKAPGGGGRVEHSVGNRQKKKQQQQGSKKGKGGAGEAEGPETEADREDLAVEVDGVEDRRGETDTSAFVEALRKRGFVLQGEDMSNKMFVRMLFVKAAQPIKGKGVAAAQARERASAERNKKQKRFVWDTTDEDDDVDEAAILKPCVYKLR